jgi:hypothetical protein
MRDSEMRKLLVRMFKKQKKRKPFYQLLKQARWRPTGTYFDGYVPGCPTEGHHTH